MGDRLLHSVSQYSNLEVLHAAPCCMPGFAGGHPCRANDRPTRNTLREHLYKFLLRSPATSARLGPGGPCSEFPDSAEARDSAEKFCTTFFFARTRKPSPAVGEEDLLEPEVAEAKATPEEPVTAVAATAAQRALGSGSTSANLKNTPAIDPGPDLVDLLPTASALVSTSMLPFRSTEEASTWQPRPHGSGLNEQMDAMAILADAFAYRKSLARAVGAWQSAVQDERELVLELRRKQALGYWFRRTRSDMAERAADLERRSAQRRQTLKLGVARWQLCLMARRSFRHTFARLHGLQCRRCLHLAYGSWLVAVHSAKELLAHATRLTRCRVLQGCWTALRAYSQQRQLMALYRSWADVHWLRSRMTAAWQAWLRWFRKRGKVVAMRSEPQLLAAWCWLRVHAGSERHRRWLPPGSGHSQQHTWWWAPAVDLLFGPAPFDVHPHHMQAVQLTVLRGFVSALLKKILSSWQMQARGTSSFVQKVRLSTLAACLSAWKVQTEELQRTRACQQEVASLRATRSRASALRSWSRRCRRRIEHRHRAQDFAADCWHRSCRRAFLAWRIAWDWEAAVLKAQSLAGGRLLCAAMKAWVGLWHYERQEAIRLRLSGLFLRKCSLKRGLRKLHVHVGIQARRRAFLQAEAQLREAVLRKRWRWLQACWGAWRRHAEHCRLMKLYRSWADVHWLRSRLTAAWQAWLQWFRKRGKVVPMRSAPQLLAAWRWLRVHAACSGHVHFMRRPQLPIDAAVAPWQPVAAELLFGPAPFDIHPHHMQAMRPGLLELFASALRKEMMELWKAEARGLSEPEQNADKKVLHEMHEKGRGLAQIVEGSRGEVQALAQHPDCGADPRIVKAKAGAGVVLGEFLRSSALAADVSAGGCCIIGAEGLHSSEQSRRASKLLLDST
ncbi:unnamed protein product [Symbiodinium sp. CCMP2456]|nr:unnamed protein product [Symbiodinium sp. CCMP2456]